MLGEVTVEPDVDYDVAAVGQALYRDGFSVEQVDEGVRRYPHDDYDVEVAVTADGIVFSYDEPPGTDPASLEAAAEQYFSDVAEYGESAVPFGDVLDQVYDPFPDLPDAWVEQFAGEEADGYNSWGLPSETRPK